VLPVRVEDVRLIAIWLDEPTRGGSAPPTVTSIALGGEVRKGIDSIAIAIAVIDIDSMGCSPMRERENNKSLVTDCSVDD
jgi:hypothetical protein